MNQESKPRSPSFVERLRHEVKRSRSTHEHGMSSKITAFHTTLRECCKLSNEINAIAQCSVDDGVNVSVATVSKHRREVRYPCFVEEVCIDLMAPGQNQTGRKPAKSALSRLSTAVQRSSFSLSLPVVDEQEEELSHGQELPTLK